MQVVVVPVVDIRITNIVVKAHLPITHVHLHQTFVVLGIGIAAIGGELDTAAERTAKDLVEGFVCLEVLLDYSCFVGKTGFHGYIGLPVAGAFWHVNRGMSD